jgi:hypothetical protein
MNAPASRGIGRRAPGPARRLRRATGGDRPQADDSHDRDAIRWGRIGQVAAGQAETTTIAPSEVAGQTPALLGVGYRPQTARPQTGGGGRHRSAPHLFAREKKTTCADQWHHTTTPPLGAVRPRRTPDGICRGACHPDAAARSGHRDLEPCSAVHLMAWTSRWRGRPGRWWMWPPSPHNEPEKSPGPEAASCPHSQVIRMPVGSSLVCPG